MILTWFEEIWEEENQTLEKVGKGDECKGCLCENSGVEVLGARASGWNCPSTSQKRESWANEGKLINGQHEKENNRRRCGIQRGEQPHVMPSHSQQHPVTSQSEEEE